MAQLQDAGRQSTDLITGSYRDLDRGRFPLNGLCYPLVEALSRLFPGRFTPYRIRWEDKTSHWFLKEQDGTVIDLLSHNGTPFCTQDEYAAARRAHFVNHQPSRRARTLLERAGLPLPTPAHGTKGRPV